MKKRTIFLAAVFFAFVSSAFAQEETLNPHTGFPEIEKIPFAMFDEGLAFTQINRIEFKQESSNFVRQDYLVGAYFALQSKNIQPADSYLQVSAYYPVFHTFNGMQQLTKQMFLFTFDIFYGPYFSTDIWKYVGVHFIPGFHYTYQMSDEYHLHYLGIEMKAGIDLPVAHHWTIILDGAFTVDYPNLGTNRLIQPYDLAWQYQFMLGVRYSKRGRNEYAYIEGRRKALQDKQPSGTEGTSSLPDSFSVDKDTVYKKD